MALSPIGSLARRWAGLLCLLAATACDLLIYSPDNPLVRETIIANDFGALDMPVVGLFAFVPTEVEADDSWIGRALSVGVSLRLQSDAGFALMEPARFGSLLGVTPYRLDGLPDDLEVALLTDLLPETTLVYGDYSVANGEVSARLLWPGPAGLEEAYTTSTPIGEVRALVAELSEALVGLVEGRHCPEDGPGCDQRHDERLPTTTEGLRRFTNATAYFEARWLDHAVAELVAVLAVEPGFVPAAKDLLRTYNHRGQSEEMIAVLTSIEGARDDGDIQFYLGLVHFNNGEMRLAEEAFRLALALDPSLNQAHVFLAAIADAVGNPNARRREVANFLQQQEDSGMLRSRILLLSTFRSQPEVLTLMERWRDRVLPLLPPGSMPPTIDLTLDLVAAPSVTDEGAVRAGFPTAMLADAEGVWVGAHYNEWGELLRYDWEGNLLERVRGPLLKPAALAWHEGGLYVADRRLDLILRLEEGKFTTFSQAANRVTGLVSTPAGLVAIDAKRSSAIVLNAEGEVDSHFVLAQPARQLAQPQDVAKGPGNTLYVSDVTLETIVVYGPDGAEMRRIGLAGSGPGEVDKPRGLAIVDGWLFVIDGGLNHRLQAWDAEGNVRLLHDSRLGGSTLKNPYDVAVSADRTRLALADTDHHRVLFFSIVPVGGA